MGSGEGAGPGACLEGEARAEGGLCGENTDLLGVTGADLEQPRALKGAEGSTRAQEGSESVRSTGQPTLPPVQCTLQATS